MERRGASRHPADAKTVAAMGYTRVPAKLGDVSRDGCRLLTPTRLRLGERIELELPSRNGGFEYLAARVVWSQLRRAGVVFDQPISDDRLRRLISAGPDKKTSYCEVIRLDQARKDRH
ncbi:MAG: PilZ domain-containing protein [Pseudomonadota bacterium]